MDIIDLYNVPNEHVEFNIWIAMYIFFTGMSAGSFVLSSLGNVFGIKKYKPLSKLGAIIATLLLMLAPLFLIMDLEQPARFYTTLLRPNPYSVMSWGVFLLTLYPLNCVVYAWFLWRADLVREIYKIDNIAIKGLMLALLGLIRQNGLSAQDRARDAYWAKTVGTIGVPLAVAVHGYTGFILAAVAARELWHTSLMPVLFLISAIVSGIALFILVILIKDRFFTQAKKINREIIFDLGKLMGGMILIDMGLLLAELITLARSGEGGSEILWLLMEGPYQTTFLGLELLLGAFIPMVILFHPRLSKTIPGQVIASILVLIGIAAMRYNVIIGGQAIPMSRGEVVAYSITMFEVFAVTAIIGLLCVAILLALWILPFDSDDSLKDEAELFAELEEGTHGGGGSFGVSARTGEARIHRTSSPAGASETVMTSNVEASEPLFEDVELSRRNFLKTGTSALALMAVGGYGPGNLVNSFMRLSEDSLLSSDKRYAMVIDLETCIGCHSCTQACKEEYDVPAGVWRSWVKKIRKTDGTPENTKDFFLPRLCNHCDQPPCVKVCPVKATYKHADGFILQRYDKCIGCKYCVVSCPYSARFIHPEKKVVDKCTFCAHRVNKGLQPACVEACPAGARYFGDLNNKVREDADGRPSVYNLVYNKPMQTLKPEQGTKPMVFYHGADEEIMKGGLFHTE